MNKLRNVQKKNLKLKKKIGPYLINRKGGWTTEIKLYRYSSPWPSAQENWLNRRYDVRGSTSYNYLLNLVPGSVF